MDFFTIRSLPKTIYFNFKTLPFKQAMKLPVFVAYNTTFGGLYKGVIEFEGELSRGMVKIGFGGLESYVNKTKNFISMGEHAKIKFARYASFAKGVSLSIFGNLEIGNMFVATDNFRISCHDEVKIGDDVIVGWDVRLFDSDNHTILDGEGNKKANHAPIHIGNHVWIGAMAHFLKGSAVADNSVVAYQSLVCKNVTETNVIVGGSPAKVIGEHITWEK